MALCEQNVRAVCPKDKLEFNISLSPVGVTNKQSVGLLGLEKRMVSLQSKRLNDH